MNRYLTFNPNTHMELACHHIDNTFILEYGVTGARLGDGFPLSHEEARELANYINRELAPKEPTA